MKTTPPADAVSNKAKTFAVKTVPRRRKASGIRGDLERYSMARKPARATADTARGRIV